MFALWFLFVIRASSLIRHSSFVIFFIRHSSFGFRHFYQFVTRHFSHALTN